ncbi:calcium/sodium antiporter [Thiocapsa rosea]|uniref:Cation:H+ antiporter n=1 Tax=Thiocapsa rosea TaxID=69360 RepID=A0A495V7T4_9GAMM|nr:calcium/sodium antiporter [Thiocapsa rosea]RKT44760.1 cation:H+ antiporter [Thiocapsa rosea]
MLLTILTLAVGLVLLTAGAESLVRGASNIAARLGIPSLIVGLTIVAFGTSAPEMAVSVAAAWSDQADIALGNVVGSNIFNVLFILGLSALVVPLAIGSQLIRVDVPLMIGASILVLLLALDGHIGRLDGAILFSGIILYTGFQIRQGLRERTSLADRVNPGDDRSLSSTHWWIDPLWVLGGLVILVIGSRLLVTSAVSIAQALGVSELVIGLTIVAAGTSLPELATSVVASIRGERDIAVGNVVGSNVFNLLAVLGLASLVSPSGIAVAEQALRFDLPVMVAVAIACLPIFVTGREIARWEGGLFFAYYLAYTAYVVMAAMHHAALDVYGAAMLWFVLPLTGVTLAVLFARDHVSSRRKANGG